MSSKGQTHAGDKDGRKRASKKAAARILDALAPRQARRAALNVRGRLDPRSLTPGDVLQLQRAFGNRAVTRLITETARRPVGIGRETTDAHAPAQTGANETGLPDALKAGVESLSGLSLEDVRVHYNSDEPRRMQSFAYTRGADIHLAPGQEEIGRAHV